MKKAIKLLRKIRLPRFKSDEKDSPKPSTSA
jgi:hypothetical protein